MDPQVHSVVVVGAGVAGLMTARELSKHFSDVLVVEAGPNIGGRVQEIEGLTSWPIPIGPEFIHGSNSILARITEEEMKCDMREMAWPAHIYLGKEGKMLSGEHQDEELNRVDELFTEQLQSKPMPPPGQDVNGIDLLRSANATPKMMAYAEATYANDFGASLKQLGLREMITENERWDAGDTYLILDRSWRKVLAHLQEGVAVRTSWPVKTIRYSSGGALLLGPNNETIAARRVVLTPSLKVMQAGKIAFEPSLPDRKWAALSRLRMSNAIKIILVFKQKFWPSDIWDVVCTDCFVPEFWMTDYPATSKDPSLQGLCAVTCFLAGEQAEHLSKEMSHPDMVQAALEQLDRIFATAENTAPATCALIRSRVVDWSKEEYIMGAYSYPSMGAEAGDREALAAAVDGTLFFAGEATHVAVNPCIQAVMETGLRAAAQVLAAERPPASRM